jgi:hypothetical protein
MSPFTLATQQQLCGSAEGFHAARAASFRHIRSGLFADLSCVLQERQVWDDPSFVALRMNSHNAGQAGPVQLQLSFVKRTFKRSHLSKFQTDLSLRSVLTFETRE